MGELKPLDEVAAYLEVNQGWAESENLARKGRPKKTRPRKVAATQGHPHAASAALSTREELAKKSKRELQTLAQESGIEESLIKEALLEENAVACLVNLICEYRNRAAASRITREELVKKSKKDLALLAEQRGISKAQIDYALLEDDEVESLAALILGRKDRTVMKALRTSLFKAQYTGAKTPRMQHELFMQLHLFIHAVGQKRGVPEDVCQKCFDRLQDEALKDFWGKKGSLSEIQGIATRLWSSAQELPGFDAPLYFLINRALSDDDVSTGLIEIIRSINELQVSDRAAIEKTIGVDTCYRGAGLPDGHKAFFTNMYASGEKYRVPMYLATSAKKEIAEQFLRREHGNGRPPVLYILHFDPKYKCVHVNFLGNNSLLKEAELLFVPYSTFTVRSVDWKESPNWKHPHIIELDVAPDNKLESEDLPLAPWH